MDRIELEPLYSDWKIFPALNSIGGNSASAGNNTHAGTQRQQMHNNRQPVPKEIVSIIADYEDSMP